MAETSTMERPSSRPKSERRKHRESRRDSSTPVTFSAPEDTPPPAPTETVEELRKSRDELSETNAELNRDAIDTKRRLAALEEAIERGEATERQYADAFRDWFVEEDYRVLTALTTPEEFVKYADEIKKSIVKAHEDEHLPVPHGHELWAEVSHKIEDNIALRFSRLYRDAHISNSHKFMHEIASENFMRSIQTAQDTLSRIISVLSDKLAREPETSPLGAKIKEMQFYKPSSIELPESVSVEIGKNPDGSKIYKTQNKQKLMPVPGEKPIAIKEFLDNVKNHATETIEAESFSHNMSVLFHKGAKGDEGFWSQVSHYAEEQMKSLTMDSLHLLPDADVFMTAFQMYTKYLQNQFAFQDWTHDPKMFTPDFNSKWTYIQQRVHDDLKFLFPKLAKGGEEWRLSRAMNIGLGLSRGVFLTEASTAAWADPHRKEMGKDGNIRASYASYYTNDNAALLAFNGQHLADRWRHQYVTFANLLHLPVANISGKLLKHWDHRVLWEEMKKREQSYLRGDAAYVKEFKGMKKMLIEYFQGRGYLDKDRGINQEKVDKRGGLLKRIIIGLDKRKYFEAEKDRMLTMIDFFPNMGKVGSHLDRRGWRYEEGFDGWYVRDEFGKINLLESWKATENIGIESVRWFGEEFDLEKKGFAKYQKGELKGDLFEGHARIGEYKGIYQYLYDTYISKYDPDGKTDFKTYFDKLPNGKGDNPEATFMSRVYASMLRQRIPTKLITIDRSRLSEDGNRAWQKIMDRASFERTDFSDKENKSQEMIRSMENLMMVEQVLRLQTSEKMKKALMHQKGANKDLSQVKIDDYEVTEDRIRKILLNKLPDDDNRNNHVENAVNLFKKMNEFLDEGGQKYFLDFADRIRDNGKPFKHFPFAIAPEEMDTSFASFRNAGTTVLKRAIGDLATIEKDVTFKILKEWYPMLKDAATDGKNDVGKIVDMLKHIKTKLVEIHDDKMAYEVIHHLAYATIHYFRQDDVAHSWWRKWFHLGEIHSLAGEVASGNGTLRNVTEWTASDISKFRMELDRQQILPSNTATLGKGRVVNKRFLGIVPYKSLVYDKPTAEMEYSGLKLARDTGSTKFDLFKEYMTHYIPILIGMVFFMMFRKAAKEAEGKK